MRTRLAALVLGVSLLANVPASAQIHAEPDSTVDPNKKNFLRAAGETAAINLFVWSFNRYIRDGGTNPGFRIGFNSFEENTLNGFEWDDNNFATNQYAHPFHGSLYYNAARSNGYNYWESIPFAFGGSLMWEYMGEIHHPSINDLFATAVGGISLGESSYRLSSLVLDNTADGGERAWRELGASLFNPVRGFNRLVTGRMFKKYPNPVDRYPESLTTTFDVGLRTVGEHYLWDSDTTNVFAEFKFEYGDPYEDDIEDPFDAFELGLQLNFSDKQTLGRVQTRGALFNATLAESEDSRHRFQAYHHFDYYNNRAFEYGAQALGGAFLSSIGHLRTEIHLNLILMGATESDYPNITGRDYDYGPGVGFKFRATLDRWGRQFFLIGHEEHLIHTLNGNDGNHIIRITRARMDIPVVQNLAVAGEYILYQADRNYLEFDDVYERTPQFRIMLAALLAD